MKFFSIIVMSSALICLTACGGSSDNAAAPSNVPPTTTPVSSNSGADTTTPLISTATTTAAPEHTFVTFTQLVLDASNQSEHVATVAIADENDQVIFRTSLQPAQQKGFILPVSAGNSGYQVHWSSFDTSIDNYNTQSQYVTDLTNALTFEGFN